MYRPLELQYKWFFSPNQRGRSGLKLKKKKKSSSNYSRCKKLKKGKDNPSSCKSTIEQKNQRK